VTIPTLDVFGGFFERAKNIVLVSNQSDTAGGGLDLFVRLADISNHSIYGTSNTIHKHPIMTQGKVAVLLSGRGSTNYPPTVVDIVCLSLHNDFSSSFTVSHDPR
jgi:hypothetical protein